MITKVLLAVAALALIFVIIVATRPAQYEVRRSAQIDASPSAVFAEVNDFHRWAAWNPWGKLDPAMKQSYEGAASGVGARYSWAGNNQVGEGRMTIIESRSDEHIKIQMEFLKPFAGNSEAQFSFKPVDEQTLVTWSMSGKNNFMAKAIGLFMNMDKMIGGQFDKGLADMKTIIEQRRVK